MTNSISTSLKVLIPTLGLLISFAVPAIAMASVHITKVMYDPPGADQGHEWIEVSNEGSTEVSLSSYRLSEGGTNHKISVVSGSSIVGAGTSVVIASNPAQYLADHPDFLGALFKSSFSLSNTGETIQLKDAKLAVVDSYSYTAPLVLKEPTPPKQPTKSAIKPLAVAVTPYTGSRSAGAAALPVAAKEMPALPNSLVYSLGLLSVLVVGVGAALYARPLQISNQSETKLTEDSFELVEE